jgi:hypothetical protein
VIILLKLNNINNNKKSKLIMSRAGYAADDAAAVSGSGLGRLVVISCKRKRNTRHRKREI